MEHSNTLKEGEKENSTPKGKEVGESVDKRVYFFTPFTDKNGKQRTKCRYCDRTYIIDPAKEPNGTPGMNNHVRVCKNNPDSDYNKALQCQSFSVTGDSKDESSEWEYDEADIREKLVHMIIIDGLPFRFVEGAGFKAFMAVLCPQFVIPTRKAIARECYKTYLLQKKKLMNYFIKSGQRVSLSIGTWTSNRGRTYLCLTGHYIDDSWKLHRTMLNFIPCCFISGDEVGSLIEDCLVEWGIDQIFTVIAENASSSDAIAYLRSRFVDWGTIIMDGKFLHMRCMSHIVNVVLKDELNELNEAIERIREVVGYVRHLEKFNKFVAEERFESKKTLCLDVPTRWDSTYKMLERALDFKGVFDKYKDYDDHFSEYFMHGGDYGHTGLPTERDWIVVERFVEVLHYFHELTLRVSGNSIVTSNTFFDEIIDVDYQFKEWLGSDDADLVDMVRKIKSKFDNYWGEIEQTNMMLYIAVMLDPRYKFVYVECIFKDMYGHERGEQMAILAKNAFYDLYKEYEILYLDDVVMSSHSESVPDKTESGDNFETGLKVVRGRKNKYLQMLYKMGRANQSELDMYLHELTVKDHLNFDVVDWWKMNSTRFPILSRLARDVLAMPISTRSLEYAFSIETPKIDDFRASLTIGFTQAMICCQDWLRNSLVDDEPVEDEDDD